jgi:quinol-cytochrome oxidoreductase complex cytochrome b subunit
MATSSWAVAVGAVILMALAFPYVRRAKHERARTFAAYLLFIAIFALASAALYVLLGTLLVAFDLAGLIERPVGAVLFLAALFIPAFLIARQQIRRPPHRRVSPN